MAAFNPQSLFKICSSLLPIARTATAAGRGVDTLGYTHALVILDAGAVGDTVTVTVQSATAADVTYAAITGATFGAITSSNDNKIYAGLVNLKQSGVSRYIRVNAAFAGSTSSVFSAYIILLNAEDSALGSVQAAYQSASTTADADANVLSYTFSA